MKYIIILGDGMADEPLAELGGRTPLEYAEIPNMDRIAREGRCGMLRTVPDGFEPGSDIANLSILGYDPRTTYTGRGPLEAVSMGVTLQEGEIAYRCNLVTVRDGVMEDFNAGHISSAEGAELLRDLDAALGEVRVYPGVGYRNLMVVPGALGAETTAPHDIVGSRSRISSRAEGMPRSSSTAWNGRRRSLQTTRSTGAAWRKGNSPPPGSGRGAAGRSRRLHHSRRSTVLPAG